MCVQGTINGGPTRKLLPRPRRVRWRTPNDLGHQRSKWQTVGSLVENKIRTQVIYSLILHPWRGILFRFCCCKVGHLLIIATCNSWIIQNLIECRDGTCFRENFAWGRAPDSESQKNPPISQELKTKICFHPLKSDHILNRAKFCQDISSLPKVKFF